MWSKCQGFQCLLSFLWLRAQPCLDDGLLDSSASSVHTALVGVLEMYVYVWGQLIIEYCKTRLEMLFSALVFGHFPKLVSVS